MDGVLVTQSRVLGALVLRETRVAFGNSQLGYFWAVFQPTLSTMVLVGIFAAIGRPPSIGTSFALFFGTGIFTFQYYNKLTSSLMTAVQQGKGLLTYPLVKETDLLLAKFIFVSMTYALIMMLFYGCLIVVGEGFFPKRLEEVILALAAIGLLGLGGGVTNAVLLRLWPTWKQVEAILSRPLFFLSGIFYIPSEFPPEIYRLLAWNPVLHGVEWVREGYYGYYDSIILDKTYLLSFALVLLLFGFSGERLYRKKVQ
ncbi:ABC transporter [Rhodobacteraceae bacterium RKSG542]|uniref:ABC transporter permease n=1 Tax=Pseudovibrio flavus TaxID=2529854 RepID=UPI0012BCF24F|nr:ABC transporter permease [Pseudovibrio flavus]MTI16710.1 ABC transporter [Pseudovibrio flavus]